MAEKRARKTEEEVKEHKANEILKRKANKVFLVNIHHSLILATNIALGYE
jgi:hypothetical protein